MRREEAQTEQPHSYTTARTLLSILRLSQALARLRLDDVITRVRKCHIVVSLTWSSAKPTCSESLRHHTEHSRFIDRSEPVSTMPMSSAAAVLSFLELSAD